MKPEELTGRVTDTLNSSFDSLDTFRSGALDDLRTYQQGKRKVLQREETRLIKKLGPDHQKVIAVGAKIRTIDNMAKDLDVLITEANIKVESVDKNTWKIHGKVIDKDRKGIKGLTVALYDEKGKWLSEMGYGCTNDQGYFSITYATDDKTEQKVSPDKKLFLYLLDKKHNILYKDSVPLIVSLGNIDYKTIYLSGENDVCVPPTPDEEDTRLKGKWVVKGRVTDESGKGLGGLTLSLYDKEQNFDDKLGTVGTDENGYFIAEYEAEHFRDVIEANPNIYLKAFDKEGNTLYSSRKKIKFEVGRIETFKIRINMQ